MQIITDEIYGSIAEQIAGQIEEERLGEGVVELEADGYQLVVWWEACAVQPLELKRWMVLSFEGGVRCGNDFSVDKFMEIYNLKHIYGSN